MSKANRKANKAKRYSHGCRNNGTCGVCVGNRTHVNAKREEAAEQRLGEDLDLVMREAHGKPT